MFNLILIDLQKLFVCRVLNRACPENGKIARESLFTLRTYAKAMVREGNLS